MATHEGSEVAQIKKLLLANFCFATIALLAGCPGNSTAPPTQTSAEPTTQTSAEPTTQTFSATSGLPEPDINVRHHPIYDAAPQTSTIKVELENLDSSISKLTIHAITGALADCVELGLPSSLIPCRKNTMNLSPVVCEIVEDEELDECELTFDATGGFLTTYMAVATLQSGAEISTPTITYSGGGTITNTASPVWWHTDFDTTLSEVDRISIAFFPNSGLHTDLEEFSAKLSSIVRQSMFTDDRQFSRAYKANRHYFDIWAFPHAGAAADFDTCQHTFSGVASEMDGLVRGSAILHKKDLRDCSSIGKGGVGTVDVGKIDRAWIFVHESSHFLFGLADEYGDGRQVAVSEPPNVFDTPGSCSDILNEFGGSAVCEEFGQEEESHRVRTTEPETMKTRQFNSDFRNTSDVAVQNRFNQCATGKCYE
jgi:hypothetical protein